MTSISSYPVHFQPPKVKLEYVLGPDPQRTNPNTDKFRFFLCDSASVQQTHSLFKDKADSSEYSRYEGLSPKNTAPVVMLGMPPTEIQILNDYKERTGKMPSFPHWVKKALEGQGIVKSFSGMRCIPYLFQIFLIPFTLMLAISVISHKSDILPSTMRCKKDEPKSCDPKDRERSDLRIQSFYECALRIHERYPLADIYFYIRCDALVGRINEIKSVDRNGRVILEEYGTLKIGTSSKSLKSDLDVLLKTDTFRKRPYPMQPLVDLSHGNAQVEWEDLVIEGAYHMSNPKCIPLCQVAQDWVLRHGFQLRFIPDTNVFSHRYHELRDMISRFRGDIKLASLPEVELELGRGIDPVKRDRRWKGFQSLITSVFSERWTDVGTVNYPTLYKPGQPSQLDTAPPEADLRVRAELALLIRLLEATRSGHLVFVFITIDYGSHLLIQAIKTDTATLICIRVDDREERGTLFLDLIYSILREYFE